MKRVVTVQDVSCVGKCSLTVALPIISAAGVECAVVPTAVLSTHTAFPKFTFCDLTDEIEPIANTWKELDITFDAIYTGYLGSHRQLSLVGKLIDDFKESGTLVVIDPVMADNGVLYKGFTPEFAAAMAKLCAKADLIVPNLTEASFMLGIEYKTEYDCEYILRICRGLRDIGIKNVLLTGVSFEPAKLGIAFYQSETDTVQYHFEDKIPVAMHGTGDVFASVFSGALLGGVAPFDAGIEAARFVVRSIMNTMDQPEHFYGVNFEGVIAKDRNRN